MNYLDLVLQGQKTADPKQSFTTTQADDGTQTIAGGYFGQYLDMEGTAKSEADLIRRYREIALHPECDMAIEDIVNEVVVANELKDAVRVNVDNLPYGKDVRRKIEDEFGNVLNLLNFNTKGTTFLEDGMLMVVFTIIKLLIEMHNKRHNRIKIY